MCKGATIAGYGMKKALSLRLRILPPWWSTWWFRAIFGASLLSSLWCGLPPPRSGRRAASGRDPRAERTDDQSAGGGADAHRRRAARWRSPADHFPYSQAGQGETSGATRFGSDSNGQWFAATTHPDRNGHPSSYRMNCIRHYCKRRACRRPCRPIARSSARCGTSLCRVKRTRV